MAMWYRRLPEASVLHNFHRRVGTRSPGEEEEEEEEEEEKNMLVSHVEK